MGILHIYEWFRPTKSNKKSEKPIEREYDFDAGFTGDKKKDMNFSRQKEIKKEQNKKEKDDSRDER